MKNGLHRIDPYLTSLSTKISFLSIIEIHLLLNIFLLNENLELDVIECASFCENTGKWI